MDNCPDDFYYGCVNAQKKCRSCAAMTGDLDKPLFFESENECLYPHPIEEQIKEYKTAQRKKKYEQKKANSKNLKPGFRKRSKIIKNALKEEGKVTDRINKSVNSLKQTIASGSVFGDGDIKSTDGLLQIDHKSRTTSNAFSLSRQEYLKGTHQGTNAWIITSGKTETERHSVVLLTEYAFSQLLARAESSDGSTES